MKLIHVVRYPHLSPIKQQKLKKTFGKNMFNSIYLKQSGAKRSVNLAFFVGEFHSAPFRFSETQPYLSPSSYFRTSLLSMEHPPFFPQRQHLKSFLIFTTLPLLISERRACRWNILHSSLDSVSISSPS